MNVKPVASPHQVVTTQSNPTAQRNKAIEAFKAGKSSFDAAEPVPQAERVPEHHSVNPNNISPEEVSAIRPALTSNERSNELAEETAVTVETHKEEKPQVDPALSRQFAQLAKQERQLRAKVQAEMKAIEAQKAELATQQASIKSKEQEYSEGYISKDQLKRDTLRILADSGVSYDELTQQILNQSTLDPRTESTIARLEAKIASLEEKANLGVKAQEEQQQQAYRAAVKQIETDVRNLVRMDPNFETIQATRSTSDVVELIEETYKKDGILMSVEDACKEVEDYLVEEAMKVTRIGKIKRQLEQAGQPKPSQTAKPVQTQPGPMKTLTNAATSTRKLSAKERAMLAFKGELKQ